MMLLSEFNHAVKIISCPRTTICNKCEQSNMSGNILNAGDNSRYEEMFGFSESYFKTAPSHLDECTKHKILKLQQNNVRPQKIIENPNIIPDKTYQMDEPDDNISDERDQITKIMKKNIIQDEETEQMKNLSTTIETKNIKTINHEEWEKSMNEERDLKNKMDEYTMLTKNNRNVILMLFREEVK